MELEAVHRELAMALEEANGERTRAQHALDADGDLRLVGALDEDAPAGGLDDGGVVEAHTLAARELRLLVGIDVRTVSSGLRRPITSRMLRARCPIGSSER